MDEETLTQYVVKLSKVHASCTVLIRQLDNLSEEFLAEDLERAECLTGIAALLKDLSLKIRETYIGLSNSVG